jgi:hypothetical protein
MEGGRGRGEGGGRGEGKGGGGITHVIHSRSAFFSKRIQVTIEDFKQ